VAISDDGAYADMEWAASLNYELRLKDDVGKSAPKLKDENVVRTIAPGRRTPITPTTHPEGPPLNRISLMRNKRLSKEEQSKFKHLQAIFVPKNESGRQGRG